MIVSEALAMIQELRGRVQGRDAMNGPSLRNPIFTIGQELEFLEESLGRLYPDDDLGMLEATFIDFATVYNLGGRRDIQ
jgi:hypothetical protein